jgi:hypothetical protein
VLLVGTSGKFSVSREVAFPITAITRDDGDPGDLFLIRAHPRESAVRFAGEHGTGAVSHHDLGESCSSPPLFAARLLCLNIYAPSRIYPSLS